MMFIGFIRFAVASFIHRDCIFCLLTGYEARSLVTLLRGYLLIACNPVAPRATLGVPEGVPSWQEGIVEDVTRGGS